MHRFGNVLIVDDDPIARAKYAAYFVAQGVGHISDAANGAKAIRKLEQAESSPDLLVLDLYMPELDGIEVLGHLRNIGFSGSIILASGATSTDRNSASRIAAAYGLDVIGELRKPVTKELLDGILSAAGQSTADRAAGSAKRSA